ncbi:MAG: tetratricopeptide repeat protein [Deltaproteobacteria bacterium]|nr:tetratricopeptide repeat protein [Deltaproteobacteria bacterium]
MGAPSGAPTAHLVPTTLKAVRALAAGKHAAAISLLSRLEKRGPEIDALVGLIALDVRKPKQAQAKLERAITRGSTRPLILYWAARAALGAGHPRQALRRAEQAAAAAPSDPIIQMGYVLLAKRSGRTAAARRALLEVAQQRGNLRDPRLYPTPAEGVVSLVRLILPRTSHQAHLHRGLAHALWQLGARLAACDLFSELRQKRAHDGDALQMLARCALEKGRPHRALELARAATKASPLLASARATLGSLLLRGGKASKAIPELRRAANARPKDAALLLQLAQACDEAQQKGCARRFYRFALRQQPKLPTALLGLGLLAQGEGKHTIARDLVHRAVQLAPHEPAALEAEAHLTKLAGEATRAQRMARRAMRVRRARMQLEKRLLQLQQPLLTLETALRLCTSVVITPACRVALKTVDPTAQRFLRAHLALRSGQRAAAATLLSGLPSKLRVKKLLREDCKLFLRKLTLGGGPRVEVRKRLLMVSTHRIR